MFSSSTIEFIAPGVSDHCSAMVKLSQLVHKPPKPFKFFNCWAAHKDFEKLVFESWNESVDGNPLVVLQKKLRRLKLKLKSLKEFSDISERVKRKREELLLVQNRVLNPSATAEDISKERSLFTELLELMKIEECLIKQKARVQWLKEGDLNTKYFYRVMKTKQQAQTLVNLKYDEGNVHFCYSAVARLAMNYFEKVFGTENPEMVKCNCLGDFLPKLDDGAAILL